MRPLPLSFYQRPALQVAPSLLGCILVRTWRGQITTGRIVEVEAYREDDPASHSFRGRTGRTEVMFRAGGHLYVYFTYGMHFCANVVTGKEGRGEAVLLRAVEPLAGIGVMAQRRFGRKRLQTAAQMRHLARGPARLCQAFHLGRGDNGRTLDSPEMFIAHSAGHEAIRIRTSPRIGISQGKEKRWRFCVAGSEWVSATR